MISKYLEKKVLLTPDKFQREASITFEIDYYLTETDDRDDINGLDADKVYGIEIVKKTGNASIEAAFVRNLSCSREETRNILDRLAYNTVMPVEMKFILDDMLGAA